eukprot:gnl/MRDRNA2_/MRDRNA2_93798_c0_seq1.p1 gnl/MRDRNA2_/MRDRNA2_93798_c0~~gnl/MRDRNA2_/MRDRNA2_93798_c0_seq1.p1  ORF type:complete len:436 (+),score=75.61 gnl/MRDRNA2_/MRDRNA2_93798_c0_seq1:174-1481(+)
MRFFLCYLFLVEVLTQNGRRRQSREEKQFMLMREARMSRYVTSKGKAEPDILEDEDATGFDNMNDKEIDARAEVDDTGGNDGEESDSKDVGPTSKSSLLYTYNGDSDDEGGTEEEASGIASGVDESSYNVQHGKGQPIPKVVHHIYKTDLTKLKTSWPSEVWFESFMSWKRHFKEPEYTHIFWSDDRIDEFFKKNCSKHWDLYQKLTMEIERSDISRYCLLWGMGGIYADLDYEPMTNFYHNLIPGRVNLVQSPYPFETVQNSLMASPVFHPFWDKLMSKAAERLRENATSSQAAALLERAKGRHRDEVLYISGPRLLSDLIQTVDASWVNVLPCNQYQRATHTGDGISRAANLKRCKALTKADYKDKSIRGIHWGTVSWDHGNAQSHMVFDAFHVANNDEAMFWEDEWGQHDADLKALDKAEGAPDEVALADVS